MSSSKLSSSAPSKSEIPNFLICPITQDVFNDPYIAMDGVTYEKVAIEEWLQQHSTSPSFGTALSSKVIVPNLSIRSALDWHNVSRRSQPTVVANSSEKTKAKAAITTITPTSGVTSNATLQSTTVSPSLSVSPPRPPTVVVPRRQQAFNLIKARFEREQWGSIQERDLKVFTIGGKEEYYVSIDSAPGDQYGYGDKSARQNAKLSQFGWGNKAVIANLDMDSAFVTTMGFHRYYWDLKNIENLGLPRSDEYGYEGGSRQDFTKGYTIWQKSRGCYHELIKSL